VFVLGLCLPLLFGVLLPLLLPATAPTSGPNPPGGVHLSFLDDPTSAVITWHTGAPSTSRAEWGISAGPPYPNAVAGVDYTSPGGSFLHAATLTGLTPGATYYYRVGDDAMASWFDGASFRAAPSRGSVEPFVFVASGKFGNSTESADTAAAKGAANPDLTLLLGDLYYADFEPEARDVWEKFQAFGEKSLVVSAIGNHDYGEPSLGAFCAFLNQPGNERTYSFTFGNTFFLGIDWGVYVNDSADGADGTGGNCGGAPGNDAIRAWADARLAEANADPNIWWKVAFHHFPCYLTDYDKDRSLCVDGTGNPDQVEDIYTARGVDLVVTGHAHTYGRTYPVTFNTTVQTGNVYDSPGAPVYTNLGTGGYGRTAACRTDPYIAVCRGPIMTFGYGKFSVSETEVAFEYRENTEGLLDSFVLRKPYDYRITLDPDRVNMLRNATETVDVAVLGRSSGPVTLAVSGCPADTSCTLSSSAGNPPFNATLTLTTSPTSPYGTSAVSVLAANATTTRTGSLTLEISDRLTRTYQRGDGGDFSDVEDTWISDGTPDTNYGSDPKLQVDGSGCLGGSTVCKTLIKFPNLIGPAKGQVPPGSQIHRATLEMTVLNPGGTHRLYRVVEPWSENTATWNTSAVPGSPAAIGPGGSFVPALGRIQADITADVQAWAGGSPNQGNLLDTTSGDGANYDSSEGPVSGRPLINVTFTPPQRPPPPGDVEAALVSGMADVAVTWTLATPETDVDHYEVWRGGSYDPARGGYVQISPDLPPGTGAWTDVGAGDAPASYFYTVRSVNAAGATADSPGQAAKLFRDLPLAQPYLVGNPLHTGSDTLAARLGGTATWSTVRAFDAADGADPWRAWYAGRSSDLTELVPWAGAWVDIGSGGDLRVAGRVPCVATVPLYAGWNLVAYPGLAPGLLSAATAGLAGPLLVEGHDPAAAPYFLRRLAPDFILTPTEALWIRSPSAQLWTTVNDPSPGCR
jgi:hypothetical protein